LSTIFSQYFQSKQYITTFSHIYLLSPYFLIHAIIVHTILFHDYTTFTKIANKLPTVHYCLFILQFQHPNWEIYVPCSNITRERHYGCSIVRHEPTIMDAIRENIEVFRIFEEAGWMTYLERLNGFNGGMAL